jgi:hypothetical protein
LSCRPAEDKSGLTGEITHLLGPSATAKVRPSKPSSRCTEGAMRSINAMRMQALPKVWAGSLLAGPFGGHRYVE